MQHLHNDAVFERFLAKADDPQFPVRLTQDQVSDAASALIDFYNKHSEADPSVTPDVLLSAYGQFVKEWVAEKKGVANAAQALGASAEPAFGVDAHAPGRGMSFTFKEALAKYFAEQSFTHSRDLQ